MPISSRLAWIHAFGALAMMAAMLIYPAASSRAASDQPLGFEFGNIDGGVLRMADWQGKAVLVVNTASQCGFTGQYDGLQTLYETYQDAGLVVLAVPSDDFRQELDSAAQVKEFCELNFGITMPMAEITHVRGAQAHEFYQWVRNETGFEPRWNFNKVLIGPEGQILETFGATVRPMSKTITGSIEGALKR
ncbi:MAG: glutathione peroxidase [Mangrovicoccus sp.]